MRELVGGSALALLVALGAGSGGALAQGTDKAQQEAQKQGGPETRPAQGAPDAPPQHQVIGPPSAGPVAATGDGLALPGASPQTAPAKFSTENASKDDHWWLDRGQDLTAEQKRAIYAQLARNGAQSGPGMQIFAEPSAEIPLGTKLYEIPKDLAGQIPYIENFKYVVDQNRVVLVDTVNGVVAAVIEK
ncbi:MAG TPA: hypothetical protein VH765_03835 [Xanthobacteraceae bacterium]